MEIDCFFFFFFFFFIEEHANQAKGNCRIVSLVLAFADRTEDEKQMKQF